MGGEIAGSGGKGTGGEQHLPPPLEEEEWR